MNKNGRASLRKASRLLSEALEIVREVREDERDSTDNLPENLQSGDAYEKREESIDLMDDAIDDINNAINEIGEAM